MYSRLVACSSYQVAPYNVTCLWRMMTLSKSPMAMKTVISELPPWLMKGSGMPVTGNSADVHADVDEGLEEDEDHDAHRDQLTEAVLRDSPRRAGRA